MRNGHYIIDTHCHVYPQRIARRAADNISDFYDGRPHVSGDTDTLLSLMEQTGTDRFENAFISIVKGAGV